MTPILHAEAMVHPIQIKDGGLKVTARHFAAAVHILKDKASIIILPPKEKATVMLLICFVNGTGAAYGR